MKIPKILILRSATYLKSTVEAHTKSGWLVKRTYDLPTSFSILRISSSSGLRFNERSNFPIWLQSILPSPCSSKRANASRYSTNKVKIKFLKIHFDKLKRKLMKSHSYHPFRLELVQTSLLWVRWCGTIFCACLCCLRAAGVVWCLMNEMLNYTRKPWNHRVGSLWHPDEIYLGWGRWFERYHN